MNVVHICPTYFSLDSVMAGAERYSYNLAKAMGKRIPTTLITFGSEGFVRCENGLTVKCFKSLVNINGNKANPFSLGYLGDLLRADIIHCHQFMTVTTDLAIVLGAVTRKKVFVTDLAGNTDFSFSYHLPLWKGIRSLLLISDFNRNLYRHLPLDARVIYGGVDASKFSPGFGDKIQRIVHVGRVLPHKGIHHLLDVLPEGVGLDIIGRPYDQDYYRKLQELSRGKDVAFYMDCSDDDMINYYRKAFATVLPATADSGFTTVLESFACGTPVIATRIGSLPELIRDGVTGFLVPPHDPFAIREKIEILRTNPDLAKAMGSKAREEVLDRFVWDTVVDRCFEAYSSSN